MKTENPTEESIRVSSAGDAPTENKLICMDFDDWVDQFKPVSNPGSNHGMLIDDVCHLFETYGAEYRRVRESNQSKVWSVVMGNGDVSEGLEVPSLNIIEGMVVDPLVMGYMITTVARTQSQRYQITC